MLLSCTDPDPDQPPPLLRILSSRLFSMQGIHTFLATNFSSTSKYCLYSMSKCVCICWLLQCKSAVLYRSGPHLQYHSWFNKYLLWPDCLMSPCISPSELQLGSCVSSLSDWNTNTPHVCGSRAGEVCSAPLPWPDCLMPRLWSILQVKLLRALVTEDRMKLQM